MGIADHIFPLGDLTECDFMVSDELMMVMIFSYTTSSVYKQVQLNPGLAVNEILPLINIPSTCSLLSPILIMTEFHIFVSPLGFLRTGYNCMYKTFI